MSLSDSRHGPLTVICSRWRLPRVATRLPCRVSQVPRLICPCALPPLTPGSTATASTHYFIADVRLYPNRADCPLPSRNEAEPGSLALRLAGSPFEASSNGLPRSTLDWLHVEWVIYMVSSFHLTRSARLGLAHPMNADERKCNTPMERVLGAVFEVANTLGAGFSKRSMNALYSESCNSRLSALIRGQQFVGDSSGHPAKEMSRR